MMELDDNPAPPLSESELRRKIDAINSATNLPRVSEQRFFLKSSFFFFLLQSVHQLIDLYHSQRARPVQPVFNAGTSALSRIKAIQKVWIG